MKDKDFFSKVLAVEKPWRLTSVNFEAEKGRIVLRLAYHGSYTKYCPECGGRCPGYDTQERTLRHLDTLQYKTFLKVKVPRVNCADHGIRQMQLPWCEGHSRYTREFEKQVIDWVRETTKSTVSRWLDLSYTAIANMIDRAVERGLERRKQQRVRHISVDETSFRKGHKYVTVVTDQDSGWVLYVAPDRGAESLAGYYESLSDAERTEIVSIAMDMWDPYIKATKENIKDAERKICFDKFHVAQLLSRAVDKVRVSEHRDLQKEGRQDLKKSKYLWLRNPSKMSRRLWSSFEHLRSSKLKTARAWAIKESAMSLWDYVSQGWATKYWKKWLSWASRCRLRPMTTVARTIKRYLWGIINAVTLKATTARSESINGRIQTVKRRSRGFRNKENYIAAIYFHLGGLDLYPR